MARGDSRANRNDRPVDLFRTSAREDFLAIMAALKSPPKELAFDIWLGPAPMQPYHENLVHYKWHWFWDTGNGDIGNQGVHEMDVARWAIKGATLPKRVISMGGRFTVTAGIRPALEAVDGASSTVQNRTS